MLRHALRLAVPATAAAGMGGAIALAEPSEMEMAMKLRNTALRARDVLTDPPQLLARVARSEWRRHAGQPVVEELQRAQTTLRNTLSAAARAWGEETHVDPALFRKLERATADAEAAVTTARESAVRGAERVAWSDLMGDVRL
jgi:hypothetical protein